jgi:hypothetical protein
MDGNENFSELLVFSGPIALSDDDPPLVEWSTKLLPLLCGVAVDDPEPSEGKPSTLDSLVIADDSDECMLGG